MKACKPISHGWSVVKLPRRATTVSFPFTKLEAEMKSLQMSLLAGAFAATTVLGQLPDALVVEGVPPIPDQLKRETGSYLESRTAAFCDWHPQRREILISTRFGDAPQLHVVQQPGGARQQLTFTAEPVSGGLFDPRAGEFVVFSVDSGGGEFFQLYRQDFADGRVTLLTDGKSRNLGARWSNDGRQIAYSSTRRNGRDTDLYVMDPRTPASDHLLAALQGGGWTVQDWSPDDAKLLVRESISADESRLHLCDAKTGAMELLTPKSGGKSAWNDAAFAKDGKSLLVTTDRDSEFLRLGRYDPATQKLAPLAPRIRSDVESLDVARDGRKLAFVSNENGASVLHLLDLRSGKALPVPKLPLGVITGLKWHPNSRELAFSLSSARSPEDVFSLDTKSGKLERWTESETGGLNPASFVEPELVRIKSFDGLEISGFLYQPDPRKFPGPRPVIVNIHGGPESQARPKFQARNNFWMSELGVAMFHPNVRGSTGQGKTFLALDDGFKREDTVRDIGAFLDWIARDPRFAKSRVAVMGGSYGGYMTLACMVHFNDRLRCGMDSVGISHFITFLKNTQDYRRDLRRAEYGDERDPAMAEFLNRISPANHADRIQKPLLVVQGLNDPRVPASESQQMVKAIRDQGGTVWFLMAKDEGHGFHKKRNVDFMFYSTVLFAKEHLLNN
jgi:dipeptidyl aminopeptidase/acylaminoacyl peptidase